MKIEPNKARIAMAKQELKLKDLASAYGCSYQRMFLLISGKNVRPLTAGKIAAILKVPVEELVTF